MYNHHSSSVLIIRVAAAVLPFRPNRFLLSCSRNYAIERNSTALAQQEHIRKFVAGTAADSASIILLKKKLTMMMMMMTTIMIVLNYETYC